MGGIKKESLFFIYPIYPAILLFFLKTLISEVFFFSNSRGVVVEKLLAQADISSQASKVKKES